MDDLRSPLAVYPSDKVAGAGKGKTAIAIAAALAIATPLVAHWEGKSNTPYADKLAGGLLTVCYGETRVTMRRYSDVECEAMLRDGLADFAAPVLQRNPELASRPHMLAAASSLAYNTGVASYRRSSVARNFSAGQWKAACDAFLRFRFAGGKEVPGLLARRRAERATCLEDLT